jgi:carboxyl-terminal processing protease
VRRALAAILASLALAATTGSRRAEAAGQDSVNEAIDLIEARYGDRVDPEILWRAATAGVAAGLDAQLGVSGSAVLTDAQYAQAQRWFAGERQGIGVEFSIAAGQGLRITDVFAGGPAAQVGVQTHDLVVAMDGHPFVGQPVQVIHAIVAQATGPRVVLEVRRGSDRLRRMEVQRGPYDISDVKPQDAGGDVPVLRIPFFGTGTARSLAKALQDTPEDGDAIVLDLRDNTGGQIDEAVEAADLFLDPGAIVLQLEGPDGRRTPRAAEDPRVFGGDVVVLVNQGTRGAAEAFVASLRGHGVGRLVGTRTGGDDAVPAYHQLGNDLVLQIPENSVLDPAGRSWRRAGLDPDVVVEPVQSSLPPAAGAPPPYLQRDAAQQLARPDRGD